MAEEKHKNKGKEAERLLNFAQSSNLFYPDIDEDKFMSEGAEQRVFIEGAYVLKLMLLSITLLGKITFIIYYYTTTFLPIPRINFWASILMGMFYLR